MTRIVLGIGATIEERPDRSPDVQITLQSNAVLSEAASTELARKVMRAIEEVFMEPDKIVVGRS